MFELYSAEKDVQVDESTEKVRDAVQTAEDAILEKNEVKTGVSAIRERLMYFILAGLCKCMLFGSAYMSSFSMKSLMITAAKKSMIHWAM